MRSNISLYQWEAFLIKDRVWYSGYSHMKNLGILLEVEKLGQLPTKANYLFVMYPPCCFIRVIKVFIVMRDFNCRWKDDNQYACSSKCAVDFTYHHMVLDSIVKWM